MTNIFILVIVMTIISTSTAGCIKESGVYSRYSHITASQAREMMDYGGVYIIDVRTQEEYDKGHIKGSTSIPLYQVHSRLDEIPKNKKILVYSREGELSITACEILADNGFDRVYTMDGGIVGWINVGNDKPRFFEDPLFPGTIGYSQGGLETG